MNTHTDRAKRILAANDRGGYTVPTDRLYPFQWNWDSPSSPWASRSTISIAPIASWNGWSKANGLME